jgi:hypothetical protein
LSLVGRRLNVIHYIGAAILAGTVITLLASGVLMAGGVLQWSPTTAGLLARRLWLVPTTFSVMGMVALSAADALLECPLSLAPKRGV